MREREPQPSGLGAGLSAAVGHHSPVLLPGLFFQTPHVRAQALRRSAGPLSITSAVASSAAPVGAHVLHLGLNITSSLPVLTPDSAPSFPVAHLHPHM